MFAPIILGSDKTTVSVATGQNEYYPLYMSLGNLTNSVRRAHQDALAVIGFLAIPKGEQCCYVVVIVLCWLIDMRNSGERQDLNDKNFRKFRRQLFHSSLSMIL